jgi:hypothetical protein
VTDPFELDSISDIVKTEGFDVLLAQLDGMAKHHEEIVVQRAAREPIDEIRVAAGRANGIRLVISHLRQAKERARRA